MGIWWLKSDEHLVQAFVPEWEKADPEQVKEGKADISGWSYLRDLLTFPEHYKNDNEWLEHYWGPPRGKSSAWIGICLDPEPEVNEFGVVMP